MGNHYDRAQALFRMKRYREAASEFTQELAETPNSVAPLAGLASSTLNLGDHVEAERLIRQVLALSPSYAYGFYLQSFIESQNGRPASAIEAIHEAIRISPRDPDYHYRLAFIYYYQNRFDEALAATITAMEIDPRHIPSILLRGNTLTKLRRIDEAKSLFRIALTTDPEHAEAHYELGKLELEKGSDPEAALELLTEARRLDPVTKNDPETIALAYGRLIRPFSWIDRLVIRWQNWPIRTMGIVTLMITIACLIFTRNAGPSDATARQPFHYVAFFVATAVAMNYLVFTNSFDQLAANVAIIVARHEVGASWKQSSDGASSIFGIVILHLVTTGLARIVATQPFIVPICLLLILNTPVLCIFKPPYTNLKTSISIATYFTSYGLSVIAAWLICFASTEWSLIGILLFVFQVTSLQLLGKHRIIEWRSRGATKMTADIKLS